MRLATLANRATIALAALFAVTVVSGCAADAGDADSDESKRAVAIGRHASDNPGSVNTFWLEGPDGLIIIDGQRTPDDAAKVVAAIKKINKPVAAILVTHDHPDHVGGLGTLKEAFPAAEIHASEATADVMKNDPKGLYELARNANPAFPEEVVVPDRIFSEDAAVEVGGIRLETAKIGPAETEAAIVFYEPQSQALFTGDLLNTQGTPALIEGHTCGWLTELEKLSQRFPNTSKAYPGHGAPGDKDELVAAQEDYLKGVRTHVSAAIAPDSPDGDMVNPAETQSIAKKLNTEYPNYQKQRVADVSADQLMKLNIDAVAQELRMEKESPSTCGN